MHTFLNDGPKSSVPQMISCQHSFSHPICSYVPSSRRYVVVNSRPSSVIYLLGSVNQRLSFTTLPTKIVVELAPQKEFTSTTAISSGLRHVIGIGIGFTFWSCRGIPLILPLEWTSFISPIETNTAMPSNELLIFASACRRPALPLEGYTLDWYQCSSTLDLIWEQGRPLPYSAIQIADSATLAHTLLGVLKLCTKEMLQWPPTFWKRQQTVPAKTSFF